MLFRALYLLTLHLLTVRRIHNAVAQEVVGGKFSLLPALSFGLRIFGLRVPAIEFGDIIWILKFIFVALGCVFGREDSASMTGFVFHILSFWNFVVTGLPP